MRKKQEISISVDYQVCVPFCPSFIRSYLEQFCNRFAWSENLSKQFYGKIFDKTVWKKVVRKQGNLCTRTVESKNCSPRVPSTDIYMFLNSR